MATYKSICYRCHVTYVYQRPIIDRYKVPICANCGKPTERVLDAPMGFVDTPAAG